MLIDIIAFVLLITGIFKGLRKGFIIALFTFMAFFIGLAAALKLSAWGAGYLGANFNISHKWLPVLAFLLVFIVVIFLVRTGAKLLEGIVRVAMMGWINKLAGVLFYLLIYLFIYSILLFYSTQLHLINNDTIKASVTYGFIQPLAPGMMAAFGFIFPVFKNLFEQLLQFFQGISDKNKETGNSYLLINAGKTILL